MVVQMRVDVALDDAISVAAESAPHISPNTVVVLFANLSTTDASYAVPRG
jgi:hypothetical protein